MLNKLEMFLAVVKEGHFGRAAARLGIAQPTLSTGIQQLEDQLGVQLVIRGSHYGGLTPEGQRALHWARQIVSDARQLRDEMRYSREGLSGAIRLAVIPTALTWAGRLTARFSAAHPNVRFTVLSRTSVEILSMLENLDVDAGISYLDNEPTGRVSTEALYHERYRLVCREDAEIAQRTSLDWAELDGMRLCLLTPDMQNRRIINRRFAEAGITPEARIEANSTIVLVANVLEGDWVTILPADMAAFLSIGQPLRMITLGDEGWSHTVGLIAPYREPHTPVLRELLAEARRLSEVARQ